MKTLISKCAAFFFISLFIFTVPSQIVYAKAGCCSGHQGVAGPDPKTGVLKCKDGTDAGPTCEKAKKATGGCCSGHGGVDKCDKSGFKRCKDGTLSGTCKCKK